MTEVTINRWLNVDEASSLLQRFMPHKNALEWLSYDRKIDPVIPFAMRGDDVFYNRVDLEYFVSRCLVGRQRVNWGERRARAERRRLNDQRVAPNVRLSPAMERRRYIAPDRRGTVAMERRQ